MKHERLLCINRLARARRKGYSLSHAFNAGNTQSRVVSSCTGTQRNETLTNCVTTPCMDMKTIGIPPCTGTPGQPPIEKDVDFHVDLECMKSCRYFAIEVSK